MLSMKVGDLKVPSKITKTTTNDSESFSQMFQFLVTKLINHINECDTITNDTPLYISKV